MDSPEIETTAPDIGETAAALTERAERLLADVQAALPPPSVPRATYRLQLNRGFTFHDAARIMPYLAALGISHIYASPYLKASPESTHGYDVTDYGALNPAIGDVADYAAFVAALHRHGLAQVLDFVPNHMGIGGDANPWWRDVLENGQSSPYAAYFDIDWRPLKPELRGQVLLPILGEQYGAVLEAGELQLRYDDGAFTVWYHDTALPIAPPTYPLILREPLPALTDELGPDDAELQEYQSIVTALENLPDPPADAEQAATRQREQAVAKRRLDALAHESPAIRDAIAATVRRINGTPGEPASFDLLDRLLEAQSYRLAFWRVAAEEINYRRFFAINELAAIRQEEPAVFAATHAFVLRLAAEGAIAGFRIDHPDGLWDPAGYFRDVQQGYVLERARLHLEQEEPESDWETLPPALRAALDRAWDAAAEAGERPPRPLYLVAEKILEPGENLPEDWAITGTVGYEFARSATGLLVDPTSRKAFDDLYARFIGERINFPQLVYDSKKLIMREALASEVNVLARALDRLSEQNRRTRDFTANNLRFALREVIACFPVYRTYVVCGDPTLSEQERRAVETAVALAKRRNRASDPSVFDFLRDVLLLQHPPEASEAERSARCRFVMKFQQLTAPVMAKGLEDTAFYIYNRLIALNEVGSDPAQFGVSPAEFHRQNAQRLRRWPHGLLASSTHDTKRSEDVRARIAVLSEMPREWRAALNRWARLNRKHKTKVEGVLAPSRNDEYLLYQTLLGAWPYNADEAGGAHFGERIVAAMLKAVREAQVHTSWVNPDPAYDEATEGFVRALLNAANPRPFLDDFQGMQRTVAHFGAVNALAQQLLKLTAPGVADIYQGTELWDQSLVDPDNRRPVDYARRQRLLADLQSHHDPPVLAAELVASMADGRIKLYLTARALAYRRTHPDLFATGDYVPLAATGSAAEHVVAFARRSEEQEVIVAVPRLPLTLMKGELAPPLGEAVWARETLALPAGAAGQTYRNVFTDETIVPAPAGAGGMLSLADVFATFPVALLARESG